MLRSFFQSLRGRILTVNGIVFIGASLAVAGGYFVQSRAALLGALEKQGFSVTENLMVRAEWAFTTQDLAPLRASVARSLRNDEITYTMVQDASGQVVSEAGRTDTDLGLIRAHLAASAWNPSEAGLFKLHMPDGALIYNFSTPVWASEPGVPGPTLLGTVRVGVDVQPTLSKIKHVLQISMLGWLIATLLSVTGTVLVTGWTLRPLRRLADVSRAIACGDLTQRVQIRGRDEIGQLGSAFNEMTASLAEHRFTLEQRREELGRIAAENARLYQDASQRSMRLSLLNDLAKSIASTLDADEILARLHEQLSRIIPYGYFTVLRMQPEGNEFRRDFVWMDIGTDTAQARNVVSAEMETFRNVRKTLTPWVVNDFASDPVFSKTWLHDIGFKSGFLVPIVHQNQFMGILGLAFRTAQAFSPGQVATVAAVAGTLGIILKNAALYTTVQASYAELKETQARLAHSESTRRAEKLRSVGQMASGIAHDFNNVLTAITGRAQLLRMKAERGLLTPEETDRSMQIIERAALDGAETVRRIQEINRHRGTAEEMRRASLNQIVRDVVEITRPRWKDQTEQLGIQVELTVVTESSGQISCVASEIREVLTNLIFNAVDALPDGGTITVATGERDGKVTVSVGDTGVGIAEAARERVFEPFFTTKGVKGSGLGLAMVFGIVERHQGTISVESTLGQGTVFTLAFPPAEATSEEAPDEATLSNAPWRILTADDEATVRDTMTLLLEAMGHEVTSTGSGRELLAAYIEGQFDLILTDLGMPDVSGWDVAREIRAQGDDVPIVLVTGWGNQLNLQEAADRGITRVLAKPFTVQKVSSLIAELQGLRRAA